MTNTTTPSSIPLAPSLEEFLALPGVYGNLVTRQTPILRRWR